MQGEKPGQHAPQLDLKNEEKSQSSRIVEEWEIAKIELGPPQRNQ